MRKSILSIAVLLIFSILLSGCGNIGSDSPLTEVTGSDTESGTAIIPDYIEDTKELFTNRDTDSSYDQSTAVTITLNGSSATASSNSVTVNGSRVTVTGDATYVISGSLNGQLIVNCDKTAKPQIVLNGVNIKSDIGAALYIVSADKVFITLAEGSSNTLTSSGTDIVDGSNIDGAIFSKDDITVNGSGSLTVENSAAHGIVAKDDLVIAGGNISVNALSHGIKANDSVRVTNATVKVIAGKDGIHSENDDDSSLGYFVMTDGSVTVNADLDGISAGSYIQIEGGTVDITAGGGYSGVNKSNSVGGFGGFGGFSQSSSSSTTTSEKGLKADGGILINGGNITVDSNDDSVHSNGDITVNGGTVTATSGDDGVHSDTAVNITGGSVTVKNSYEGIEGESINISGGEITVTATDDGMNASGGTDQSGFGGARGNDTFGRGGMGGSSSSNGSITISGGNIYITASGDGIDSNGSFTMTAGNIIVSGPNSGDTSILDFDTTGTISGGVFIGTGASSMAQNFSSSSTQGAMMVTVSSQTAGTVVKLCDSNGNVLLERKTELAFSCIILSDASIKSGSTYKLYVGSSSTDIKMTSTVYGSSNGFGGGSGGGGGGGGGQGGFGGGGGKGGR